MKNQILPGTRFSLLTVIESTNMRKNKYIVYKCQCECGALVEASSRDLKCGRIKGCRKCMPKTVPNAYDLTGQIFGDLSVIELAKERRKEKRSWVCKCSCGSTVIVPTSYLVGGRKTCCSRTKHGLVELGLNLLGKNFGNLHVIQKLDKRDRKGSIMWLCLCSCGKECTYSSDDLVHNGVVSCGCYKEQILQKNIYKKMHLIDGTCIEALTRKKRSDNSSGFVGVSMTGSGNWNATITFKGIRYNLGTYKSKEKAIEARKKGESIHKEFLEEYYKTHSKTISD